MEAATEQKAGQFVTKEMTLGDVVKNHPEAVPVMLGYGLHCIGCHVSYFETIEEGCAGHGMSEETMNKMIADLNKAIAETNSSSAGKAIEITDEAAAKIKELLQKQNKQDYGLRIEVSPGGCAGFQYAFSFEKAPTAEDKVIEENGVKLFIDPNTIEQVNGARIHYVDGLQGSGFKVTNPNAQSTCGCGQSFG